MGNPQHIAIIPDGNRRWAKQKGLLAWKGHGEGVKRFREIYKQAFELQVPFVTFWAASEDNLTKRDLIEVKFLLTLLKSELEDKDAIEKLSKNEARVRVIGNWRGIIENKELTKSIDLLQKETENYSKFNLTILFGYDGRREMLEAIKKIAADKPAGTDYDLIKQNLWTHDLPQVDLVIRTGGEPHWSAGFMMWHTTDSQFYFTETLWPDFGKEEFQNALDDYARRERRFGK